MEFVEYLNKGYDIVPLYKNKKYATVEQGEVYDTFIANTTNESRLKLIKENDYGIGIILDGLCVLDYDKKEGLESFIKQYGIDLTYPGIVTTHDGYHVWFRCNEQYDQFFCKNNIELKTKLYLPTQGSIHPDGTPYQYLNGSIPAKKDLVEFTPYQYSELLKFKRDSNVFSDPTEHGGRNVKLAQMAGLLIGKDINLTIVKDMCLAYNKSNITPCFTDKEVNVVCDSIFKTAKRNKEGKVIGVKEAEEVKEFHLTTLEELAERYGNVQTSWLIKDFMPLSSCGLFVSNPEMGKTWIMLDLALSVVTGRQFLNSVLPESTGEVWYIQQEDAFPQLLKRLRQLLHCKIYDEDDGIVVELPNFDIPLRFYTDKQFNFKNEDVIDSFTEKCLLNKPKIVLIDPMYAIGRIDDYFASTAQKMIVFKQIRDEVKTGFFVAHHGVSSKHAKADIRERDNAWGSEFLNAWQEVGWQINFKEGKKVLSRNFKNTGKPELLEFNLDFEGENDEMCNLRVKPFIAGETSIDDDSINASVVEANMIEAIKKGEISCVQDFCDEFGIPNQTKGKRILDKLGAKKKDGAKVYSI